MHVYIYISFEDTKGTGLGACVSLGLTLLLQCCGAGHSDVGA